MREWITTDLGWKLFSLFLALVVWLTVHQIYEEPHRTGAAATDSTVTYGNLQVMLVSTAADVRDFRVVPATVSVTVNGPPDAMAVLQANQIHAAVDLTNIEADKDLRRKVEVSTPPGVTLVSVNPPQVIVIAPPPPEKK